MNPQTQFNIAAAREEVQALINAGLSTSAEVLCSFKLSSNSSSSSRSAYFDCAVLELQADSVFAKKEYKRALSLFRQTFKMRVALNQYGGQQGTTTRRTVVIETADEAQIKFKEFECMLALEDATALSELESIPAALR